LSIPRFARRTNQKAVFNLQFPPLQKPPIFYRGLLVRYLHQGQPYTATFPTLFRLLV
jgi:hypothetical protein